MPNQLTAGEQFVDLTDPGDIVNALRLNNHVNGATVNNCAVTGQTSKAVTVEADSVLLGDSTATDTTPAKKATLLNLLPETIRNGSRQYAVATFANPTYGLTLTPAATAYADGMVVRFKAGAANSGAAQLNINGVGAFPIVNSARQALVANDILLGQMVEVVWNAGDSHFQIISTNVTPNLMSPSANQSLQQYAADTGTAAAYAIALAPAPTGYTPGMVVRFKAVHLNVPSGGHTTLNVNGLGAISIVSSSGADLPAGTILAGQLVEAVYDGAAFQIPGPPPQGFQTGGLALPPAGTPITPVAHGLGTTPGVVRLVLACVSTENNYSVGDELNGDCLISNIASVSPAPGFSWSANATNLYAVQNNQGTAQMPDKNTGVYALYTPTKWNIKIYAKI